MLSYQGSIVPEPHPLTQKRQSLGWSQGDLAAKAGVPRTTVSAIEGRRLNPSVSSALALGQALNCTVESLFGEEPAEFEWAWESPRGETRYWEAMVGHRRLRYPVEGPSTYRLPHDRENQSRQTLVVATCDPAAGLLAAEYERVSGYRMIVLERGGQAALELLRQGLVHLAGLHLSTPSAPDRNQQMAGTGYSLVRLTDWEECLATSWAEHGASLEAAASPDRVWALRETGSAARECMDDFLAGREARGITVSGHAAVAAAVRSGWAGAGVCVRLAAENAGVRARSLRVESMDLCFHPDSQADPKVRALLDLLETASFRRFLNELPGYDATNCGEIFHS